MKRLSNIAIVSVLCGVVALGVVLSVTIYLIADPFSRYATEIEIDSADTSHPEFPVTTIKNEKESDLLVDDLVYVNEVVPSKNPTTNWIALGKFTPMTEREVLDYFEINTNPDLLISDLSLQKITTQHGFHSKLDGTLIPKDSFVYYNEDKQISVIISIQDKSVPKYRLFEPTENYIHSSIIAGTSVVFLSWQDNNLQAICCEFDVGNISCSIETRNLPVSEVVLITKALLSSIDNS